MHPLENVNLLSKEERELYDYINQVLRDKIIIMDYMIQQKQNITNEGAQNEQNADNNN
jgi:hypothetical protein